MAKFMNVRRPKRKILISLRAAPDVLAWAGPEKDYPATGYPVQSKYVRSIFLIFILILTYH